MSLFVKLAFIGAIAICVNNGFILPGHEAPDPYFTSPVMVSELEETGWQMIFRATSGNGEDVYNAWTTGVGTSDIKPKDMHRSYSSHYRDPNVTRWNNLGIKFVKLALFKQSKEVAYVVFDGQGSDSMSWFDQTRVEAASWSDVTRQNTFNIFSIRGLIEAGYERSFHINVVYHPCASDKGNLAVIEHDGGCSWDHATLYPQFIYSDMNGAELWDKMMFGRADYLAIFINT